MEHIEKNTRNTMTRVILLAALLIGACSNSNSPATDETSQDRWSASLTTTSLESFAEVRRDPASGTVLFAKSENLARSLDNDSHYREMLQARAFADMAMRFIDVYRKDFLLDDPLSELVLKRSDADSLGYQHVRLEQVFRGLTVVGAELLLQFDAENRLNLVQGAYVPTPKIDPQVHRYSASDALALGKIEIGTDYEISGPDLVIFPQPDGSSVLAYEMRFSRGLSQGWRLTLDANDGSILSKVSTRYTN
jgi:Zn-dependent metalloprotease